MDNTQLTPLRKRNGKVSRRLAAAIEKAMGIDPADRFQTAEEFKRALLGSKSKTQRLPGEYVIQPAPIDEDAPVKQSSLERELKPIGSLREEVASEELPVFKPPKRRRKKRLLPALFLILLLLAASLVGVVRFAPQFIPPLVKDIIPQPWLSFLGIPTSAPVVPTEAVPSPTLAEIVPAETNEPPPTVTSIPTITPTPTIQFTPTLPPVVEVTATPENTPVPVATQTGGGGGQIAFASAGPGIPQIYLVNLDTTGLTQLTNVEGGACQPSWSPDGAKLAFISPCPARAEFNDDIYKDSSLYVMNADGSGITTLTDVPIAGFDPAWSPDGERIAFTSLRDGTKDIYLLTLDTGAVSRLTTATGDIQENSHPSWSPSGDQIVYMVRRFNAYQVWAMNDAGQDNVQIARSGQRISDFLPVWMADGETILFSQKDVEVVTRPWLVSIRYEDRDTRSPTRLNLPRPIEDVEVSPDGLWIVYETRDNEGNRDIYFMTMNGEARTRLTVDPAVDFDPTWRPTP
jgi:Tol biopolymer transport system component